jgi:SAM-dependent methyltransferase
MGDSDATDASYAFGSGIGEDEIARLESQGAFLASLTRMGLAEAGIRPGMRVLDLGCGTGNATFEVAELVGPGGSVVGLDHSPEALARARLRAAHRGLAQVQFIEGDIHDPAPGGPYDAIVEQLALYQVPDPAEVLRRQATVLRPGGLVAAGEADLSTWRSLPETALYSQLVSWAVEAFARAGVAFNGPQLWAIVEEAGLRPLGMMGLQPHSVPGDEIGLAAEVDLVRNVAQVIVGTGVATAEEIGVDTLEQRLREDREKTRAVGATPMGLFVWATIGPA